VWTEPVGAVLAGGRNQRFGGVLKGLERVGNLRIVDYVAAALGHVASRVVIISNEPRASAWLPPLPVVPDLHPGRGGLAGVEAALAHGEGAFVVAWDMPFVTGRLLQALANAAQIDDADVVVPASDSPFGFEPFCAFYSSRVREPLSAFLSGGGGPARDFVRGVRRLRVLSTNEVSRIGDPSRLFFSVNTPEDLERARAMAAAAK
jgi:molybdopterin-guanine dinucleotide biosynthesis protein A